MSGTIAQRADRRAPAVTFIFVTILLDWLVVGIASPVIPKLIIGFTHGDVARASAISGGFATAFALVAFVASPVLGVLSDRFGRRPILLVAIAGAAVESFILALAPNLGWLFCGRILTGLTAASATTAAAYVADVTPPERRPAAFGMVGAAFGAGFAIGPAIGGLLATLGLRVPFFVTAALMVLSFVYALVILPESLGRDKRQPSIAWTRANPLGSLTLLRRHRELTAAVLSLFCSSLAVQAFSVFVLYTISRFDWSEAVNGLGLSFFGAMSVASSLAVGRLTARFGARTVVTSGFALGALGFIIYGLAPSGALFACALPLTGLWSIAGPPLQSVMSRHVGVSEQGELQGAIGSMRSITLIVGPAFFTLVFAAVSEHGSGIIAGLPWFCGALLLGGAIVFALGALRADEAPAVQHG